jgi:hypothetical protein
MQTTYKYLLISLLICFVASSIRAQDKQEKKPEVKTPNVKWWDGMTLQVDAASIASSTLLSKDIYSVEAGAQIELKHKYLPIVELGYASVNKTSLEDIRFKTNGFFGRVGMDFNLVKKKKDGKLSPNLFLLGLRLGMTNATYTINNMVISNDYWGANQTLPESKLSPTKIWFELVFGIRVEVVKNIHMGWSLRNKHLLTTDKEGEISPWYIPGYGKNASSNWGFSYTVGYKF